MDERKRYKRNEEERNVYCSSLLFFVLGIFEVSYGGRGGIARQALSCCQALFQRALTPTYKQQVTRAPLSSDQRAHLQLITPFEALNAAQVGESFAGENTNSCYKYKHAPVDTYVQTNLNTLKHTESHAFTCTYVCVYVPTTVHKT